MKKTLLTAAILIGAGAGTAIPSFANSNSDISPATENHHSYLSGSQQDYHNSNYYRGPNKKGYCHTSRTERHGAPSKLEKRMNRIYTAEQIKVLNEALLIRRGNPNIQIGTVTPTEDGYTVQIVTKEDSLVEEFQVAKNNMPLERYNTIKNNMEKSQNKENS